MILMLTYLCFHLPGWYFGDGLTIKEACKCLVFPHLLDLFVLQDKVFGILLVKGKQSGFPLLDNEL